MKKIAECLTIGCLTRVLQYLAQAFDLPALLYMGRFLEKSEGEYCVDMRIGPRPEDPRYAPSLHFTMQTGHWGPADQRVWQRKIILNCMAASKTTVEVTGYFDADMKGHFDISVSLGTDEAFCQRIQELAGMADLPSWQPPKEAPDLQQVL